MKVSELIEKLKEMPQDATVIMWDAYGRLCTPSKTTECTIAQREASIYPASKLADNSAVTAVKIGW